MTTKILGLVDGSIYAQSVCDHAAWAARQLALPVELLHVLGRREAIEQQDLSGTIRLGARSALLSELTELDEKRAKLVMQRGKAILEDAVSSVKADGVDQVTMRLRHGDLVEGVTSVEATSAMVVVGKRGEAADFAKGHPGSNMERIARSVSKPVLVVPRRHQPVKRVLVAFDGGQSAKNAASYAASSGLFKDADVLLVFVGGADRSTGDGLEQARLGFENHGIAAITKRVNGHASEALVKIIGDDACDLVVMGAHGHSAIRRLIIGSTVTEVLQSSRVPVLLVR
jgi:nucleotide-binding universal stress UspA family protein